MVDFHAVAIDDVRDIFGADAQLSAELSDVAARAFPAEPTKPRAFLPLLRRPRDFAVDPTRPTKDDLSILLSGGYVAPDRMLASLRLLHVFLEHRAAAHRSVDIPSSQWSSAEFDLARHGVDTHYSLRRLAERQIGIPLRGGDGDVNGYAKHVHVAETVAAWEPVVGELAPGSRALLEPVLEVCRVAAERGLDVVVLES